MGSSGRCSTGRLSAGQLDEVERRFAGFLAAVATATGVTGDPVELAAAIRARAAETVPAFRGADASGAGPVGEGGAGDGAAGHDEPAVDSPEAAPPQLDRRERAAMLGWIAFGAMGGLAPGSDMAATSRAWYDELRLPAPFATGLREAGLDEAEAWSAADLVRVLLWLARPSGLGGPAATADARMLEAWLAQPQLRAAIGVNRWEGVEYLDRDRFSDLLRWASRLEAIEAGSDPTVEAPFVARLASAAEVAGFRVDALRESLGGTAPAKPRPDPDRVTPPKTAS